MSNMWKLMLQLSSRDITSAFCRQRQLHFHYLSAGDRTCRRRERDGAPRVGCDSQKESERVRLVHCGPCTSAQEQFWTGLAAIPPKICLGGRYLNPRKLAAARLADFKKSALGLAGWKKCPQPAISSYSHSAVVCPSARTSALAPETWQTSSAAP